MVLGAGQGFLKLGGRATLLAGRALEPAGRVTEPSVRAPEPAGRALEPGERQIFCPTKQTSTENTGRTIDRDH